MFYCCWPSDGLWNKNVLITLVSGSTHVLTTQSGTSVLSAGQWRRMGSSTRSMIGRWKGTCYPMPRPPSSPEACWERMTRWIMEVDQTMQLATLDHWGWKWWRTEWVTSLRLWSSLHLWVLESNPYIHRIIKTSLKSVTTVSFQKFEISEVS